MILVVSETAPLVAVIVVDPTETAGTAVVDNRFQFDAVVGSAFGDASQFYQLEFDNAGIDYTVEEELLGTAGALKLALQKSDADCVVAFNCDVTSITYLKFSNMTYAVSPEPQVELNLTFNSKSLGCIII